MLTVRCGPFQPFLERALLAEIDSIKSRDPFSPAAVVAPSRRLADRLERLICLEAGRSYVGLKLHTFHSLAEEIVREDGGLEGPRVSDPLFFERVIDRLLDRGSPRAPGRPKRLSAAYRATLKDLIDSGVEPRAADLLDEGLLGDSGEAARLRELLALLGGYERRIRELGVTPPESVFRRAADLAPGSEALGRLGPLLYYGFYDLTGIQGDFFEAVARAVPVTVFYPYVEGHPAFEFSREFLETKLRGGGAPKPWRSRSRGKERRALGRALDCVFVPGRTAGVRKGAVRVLTASGVRDEVWRAAKEIHRLVEEEGFSFGDIGVVARVLEPYRAAVREAFEDSRIPYRSGVEEPLLRAPSARACLTLLTLSRRDFPALSVLDAAESPFFRGRRHPRWRALVSRLRIHRGWLQWEGKLKPLIRRDFELYPELGAEGRGVRVPKRVSADLWRLVSGWRRALTPKGSRPWSSWVGYARRFLARNLAGAGDPGYAGVLKTLERLRTLDLFGERVSFDEFVERVEDLLARASRPVSAADCGGVRVLDAMDARGDSFRVLFVLGLREGLFPRTIREDPLLRDSARRALRQTGGYWIAAKQAGYEEEKLLFWLLCASASDRLYCCYPRSDEDGRAQIPSIYLLELCRAAGLSLSDSRLVEHVPRQPERRLTSRRLAHYLTPKELSVAAALSRADGNELRRRLGLDARGYEAARRRLSVLNRRGPPGPMDGVVGRPARFVRRLRGRGMSPSSLEMLSRCGFQYFASRVLGLDEPEEPSESGELRPSVKGDIYHEALAAFYSGLRRGLPDGFPEEILAGGLDRAFRRRGWRELGLYPLIWSILRGGMRDNLRRFLETDLEELKRSGMRPRWTELALSGALDVRLPRGLSGMPFQGRLDRVDCDGTGFRVIDYKTRWRKGRLEAAVSSGRTYQPPVYLELASHDPLFGELRPEGVRFCSLEDAPEVNGRPSLFEYGRAGHAAGWPETARRLAELVGRVDRGVFLIRPDDGRFGHCRWCSFGAVCRKNHPPSRRRADSARGGGI